VAQVFPTSAKVVYDSLVGNASFMAKLGNYTFSGGTGAPEPAIAVLSPGEPLPELRDVEGVECIIHDAANAKRMAFLSGNSATVFTWQVFLICWEGATGQDVTDAVSALMSIFPGATSTETVATAHGLGSLVQTRILIPSDMPIIG